MSNNGDFYAGYAAGQGANRQPDVDIQSFINEGIYQGRASEYAHQSWYVQRLMRSLAARNSQKRALMEALRAYEPNHPYLNETVIENKCSQALRDMDYNHLKQNTSSDDSSRMLVIKMGGGITTEGDLAMESDGIAFVESNSSEDFEGDLKQVFFDLNPPDVERQRRYSEKIADEKARAAKAKTEASDAKFASIIKPAANFMANIFGK